MAPYNDWVTHEGNTQLRRYQVEQRIRLALEVLRRVLRRDRTIDPRDLPNAGFCDLLGEFWACYGWKDRRRLARARDFDTAFLDVVLDGYGLALRGKRLRIDLEAVRRRADELTQISELRAATRTWRLQAGGSR